MNSKGMKYQHVTGFKIPGKNFVLVTIRIYVWHIFEFRIDHVRVVIRCDCFKAIWPSVRCLDEFESARFASDTVDRYPDADNLVTANWPKR